MKKIIILWFSLLLLTSCNNYPENQITNNNNQLVWWACSYSKVLWKCKITSIKNTNWTNIVKYNYNTNDKSINKKALNKEYNLTLLNGDNPSNSFLKKYNINIWKEFVCSLNIIQKWTCTPIVIDFKNINLTDYKTNKQKDIIQNNNLELTILPWWDAKKTNNWIITITKNNYILHINSSTIYAWWVENGNFNTIIENLPRKQLIINFLPAVECGTTQQENLSNITFETDLFYSNDNYIKWACNKLNSDKKIWYLSYFSKNKNSYFYSNNKDNTHIIVLATYNTDNINNLPEKPNPSILNEIRTMVQSIKIK